MRKPEQRFWDRIRWHAMGWPMLLERIENLVGSGQADLHCICRGTTTWIELKVARWPVHETSRMKYLHPMDIDQENWHLRYRRNGGRSFILVGIEHQRKMFLIPGAAADRVNKLLRKEIGVFETDWDRLRLTLEGQVNENIGHESSIDGTATNERTEIFRPVYGARHRQDMDFPRGR